MPLLEPFTPEAERARLLNLAWARRAIPSCLRAHLVRGYIPGIAFYNLWEYPAPKIREPGEEDERNLDELAARGVELIHVHEEWRDEIGHFGGNNFRSCNEPGWRRFLAMARARGLKVVVYVSMGFHDVAIPDFRPEWTATDERLDLYFVRLAHCSPCSPEWRGYFLSNLDRILSEYGLAGIMNDHMADKVDHLRPRPGHVQDAFDETPDRAGAYEDFLAEIHAVVKRHGGIHIVHTSKCSRPRTPRKDYDYLIVGEQIGDMALQRETVKPYEPYTILLPDWRHLPETDEGIVYANAFPYLQFPVLYAGVPVTGERCAVSGIPMKKERFYDHMQAMRRARAENPSAPPSYSWWDSVPGRRGTRERWYRELALFRRMTRDGTWAFLEATTPGLFQDPLPEGVVASAFVNREFFVAASNLRQGPAATPASLRPAFEWEDVTACRPEGSPASGPAGAPITIPPGTHRVLRRK